MDYPQVLAPVLNFLKCPTPQAWINKARNPENLSLLLSDHMVCELKAAQTALLVIRKYVADKSVANSLINWFIPYEMFTAREDELAEYSIALHKQIDKSLMAKIKDPWDLKLINSMMLLIKEELHHCLRVRQTMSSYNIPYVKISAGRYAKGILKNMRAYEPMKLIDRLICSAYIEARSCERFAALAPYLDEDLQKLYLSLLRSEARHYQDYLTFAQRVSNNNIAPRVRILGEIEATLISTSDNEFRFHSGVPID